MSSMGYGGAPKSVSDADYLYGFVTQVIGACLAAAIFSNIGRLINSADAAGARYQVETPAPSNKHTHIHTHTHTHARALHRRMRGTRKHTQHTHARYSTLYALFDIHTIRFQAQLDKINEFGSLCQLDAETKRHLAEYHELLFSAYRGFDLKQET